MAHTWDVIVVGSGFGGAVTACRAAERGSRVLVLERGRRWSPDGANGSTAFPRSLDAPWFFDPRRPHEHNGWLDLRFYDDMIVAQGAGVGGGSLIYANVSVEARPELFHAGWPREITYDELKPHYDEVGRMLDVQTLPDNQLTRRYRLMQEGAERLGYGERFRKLPLAVSFDRDWHAGLDEAFDDARSKKWTNAHGREQGTCVHCGNCDIGCQVQAKNTLDLNYLAVAERHGTEIRSKCLVRSITAEAGGYRVEFERLDQPAGTRSSESAPRIVLAAGSLGSTELLLRCRDEFRTLPGLSRFLGRNWSSNGDFLVPSFHPDRQVSPSEGPTITCAIDFLDGSEAGERFFIEDGGFPHLLQGWLVARREGRGRWDIFLRALADVVHDESVGNVMPWFAQGIDAADGTLYLGRPWYAPWRREMKLDWEINRSRGVIDAIVRMHQRLSEATGGRPFVTPTWTLLKNLVTPHPLGGCNMGNTAEDGVVDHTGQVFGYPGLFVADGAVVPEALGLNPSRTIAALAERTARFVTA